MGCCACVICAPFKSTGWNLGTATFGSMAASGDVLACDQSDGLIIENEAVVLDFELANR